MLETLHGVGKILAATLFLEIGEVKRFPSAGTLASYARLVPRVYSSGGKTWHGKTAPDANQFLKWAFVEAANCTVMHGWKYLESHTGKMYKKLRRAKCHPKAVAP